MIQDIGGRRLYNEYTPAAPGPHDRVFTFRDRGEVLLKGEPEEGLAAPPAAAFEGRRLQYLFRIEQDRYYLDLSCYGEQGRADGEGLEALLARGFRWQGIRTIRQMESKEIAFAAQTAVQLGNWYRDNRFCGRCGGRTRHKEDERALVCPVCGNTVYPKVMPAVIVALIDRRENRDEDRILLTKYSGRAYTRYALIAGFTEIGETAEQTVRREVKEEVGLEVADVTYYATQPWGIDSDLLLGYVAELKGDADVTLDERELSTAEWFTREELPIEGDDEISLTRNMMWAFKEGRL